MSQVDTHKVGSVLKSTREKLGLSINDISVATKISPRILKALEDSEYTELPPQSFTRGFIRSYSAYLKIEPQPILDAYNAAIQPAAPPPEAVTTEPKNTVSSNEVSNRGSDTTPTQLGRMQNVDNAKVKKVLLFSGLVLSVVIIIGVKKIIDRYAKERIVEPIMTEGLLSPEQEINSTEQMPEDNKIEGASADAVTATEATTNSQQTSGVNSATPAAATAPIASATTTSAAPVVTIPVPIAPMIKPSVPNTVAEPKPVIEVKSTAIETKPAAVVTKPAAPTAVVTATTTGAAVTATPTKPTTPAVVTPPAANTTAPAASTPATTAAKTTATTPAVKTTPQEVIIEALDGVEITIQIDNESPKKIKLAPDSVHTIKAKSSVALDIKDGGMVNLIHNGREKGVPGNLGKPTQVKFP